MVKTGMIEVKPEESIGDKRWCDLLVTIFQYSGKNLTQKIAIEVENDRKFDASKILRKIKKEQPYPTIVIIPHKEERHAGVFQVSMIRVWFWKAKCRWECRRCNSVFTTTSSITPIKCEGKDCKASSNFIVYKIVHPEDVEFVEAKNNPSLTFGEIQKKLRPSGFFLSVL